MIEIGLANLPDFIRENVLAKKDAVLAEVRATVRTYGPRFAQEEIDRAQPRPPVDRGTYRRSFFIADLPDGVEMVNTAPYAGVIEKGRRPGTMPPVRALEDWVIRKGILGNVSEGRRRRVTTDEKEEARRIAFAIAMKMKKQGWPVSPNAPMKIMEKTAALLMLEVRVAVARGLSKPATGGLTP